MVGAGGGEQQRFGARRSSPRPADRAAARGSPRRPACRPARGSAARRCPRARSASASRRAWVDLPAPSPPSKAMNRPRVTQTSPARPLTQPLQQRWPRRTAAAGDQRHVVRLPARGSRSRSVGDLLALARSAPRAARDSGPSASTAPRRPARHAGEHRAVRCAARRCRAAPSCTRASPTGAPRGRTARLSNAVEAPFEQVARGACCACAARRRAADHHHQPAPAALGRAEEVVARLAGEAGLDPVGARHDAGDRDRGWPARCRCSSCRRWPK